MEILSKTKPWQHQRDAYAFAYPERAALMGLGMGAGKSWIVVNLVVNRNHRRTLILCPKSVVDAWEKQFRLHAARPVNVVLLNEGGVAHRTQQAQAACASDGPVVLVINYESARMEPFAAWAKAQLWDLVVLDESHRIKSPSGNTSRFCWALGGRAQYRLALSGTPFAHSPVDIWSQYCFLAPWVFGRYQAFRARYVLTRAQVEEKRRQDAIAAALARKEPPPAFAPMPTFWKNQIVGYLNEDELNAKIYKLMFRVRSEDVLDLPPTVDDTRTCTLSAKARRVYRDLERDLYAEIDSGEITVANALVKLLRLQQVTSGCVQTDDGALEEVCTAKRDLLADILEDLPTAEPVVVFARFTRDLAGIREVALQQGRRVAELSGRVNELRQWQDGGADLLAVQVASGGVGIDLTRARYCFYYSLGFSLSDYLQSRARVHRPGQTRPVTYFHLLAAGTVDGQVYDALAARQDVVESILAARVPARAAA
jgi:SNF2 family DNA or RNA helicase